MHLKGRYPIKKNVYFRALSKLASPPQLGPRFSDVKKRFARMTEKSTDDDNDGFNDDYDSNDGNFDDNTNIMIFE